MKHQLQGTAVHESRCNQDTPSKHKVGKQLGLYLTWDEEVRISHPIRGNAFRHILQGIVNTSESECRQKGILLFVV